jgi:hypothetical protein
VEQTVAVAAVAVLRTANTWTNMHLAQSLVLQLLLLLLLVARLEV